MKNQENVTFIDLTNDDDINVSFEPEEKKIRLNSYIFAKPSSILLNETILLNDFKHANVFLFVKKLNRRYPPFSKWTKKRNIENDDLPVLCLSIKTPIFLQRNHLGNSMIRKNVFNKEVLVNRVSFMYCKKNRENVEMKITRRKRIKRVIDVEDVKTIEGAVNEIKMNLSMKLYLNNEKLLNYYYPLKDLLPSGNFILFEFCHIQDITLNIRNAIAELSIIGINSSTGKVYFQDYICNHYTSSYQSECKWQSYEYILPKCNSGFDEVYIYVEIIDKIFENNDMILNLNNSSSKLIRAIGAQKIAKKLQKKDYYGNWDINFSNKGIHLLDQNALKRYDLSNLSINELKQKLRKLSNNGEKEHRLFSGKSLVMEMLNPKGLGFFTKQQIQENTVNLSIKEGRKNRKSNDNIDDTLSDILYDLSSCSNQDCITIINNGTVNVSKIHDIVNRSNPLAYNKGNKKFLCIFCDNEFSSYDALKFHLEYSYPSFCFNFTEKTIKVTVNKEEINDVSRRLKQNETEVLIKNELYFSHKIKKSNRITSVNDPVYVECTASPEFVQVEMNYNILFKCMQERITDINDMESKEKEFYFLWNKFIIQVKNRITNTSILPNVVINFVRENVEIINIKRLRRVLIVFLCHLRELKQLTETEFLKAAMIGTEYEFNWFGRELCYEI